MKNMIISKEEIEAFKGINKTHFLNDNARRVNKSFGDISGITGFGFHIIEVLPGFETTELHKHYHEDECVYILEGQAEATIGDEKHTVQAGTFIGYPAGGEAHTLKNTGTDLLKCIVVGARLAHDVGEYPRQNKRIFRNSGLPWNLVDIDSIDEPFAGKKV